MKMNERKLSVKIRQLIDHYEQILEKEDSLSDDEYSIYEQIISELRNSIRIASI